MYIELHNLNGYILDQTDSDFCIQQRVQTSHKLDLHPLSRRERVMNPILSVSLSSKTYISKFVYCTLIGYDLERFTRLTLATYCPLLSCNNTQYKYSEMY